MSIRLGRLGEAKAEALAAFEAIAGAMDLAGEEETAERAEAAELLLEDAAGHLSAAIAIMDQEKGGNR